MTDFAQLLVADRGQKARPIHLVDKNSFADWMKKRPAEDRALLEAQRFDGKTAHSSALLPRGNDFEVVSVVNAIDELSPWCLASLAEKLPQGTYKLAQGEPGEAALGWLLGQHAFDEYRSKNEEPERGPRILLSKDAARIDGLVREAGATALVRDLVNRPAGDLGPAELEEAVRETANELGARVQVTGGKDLAEGYPLIAAVGAGAAERRAPRLIELEWGKPGDPYVAIVGKGVCFDSGGLDLKPASGMRLMKKDMGGAAHALALARLIIAERLPVRIRLLIPAVENAVSGSAYRPGDVIRSRKGLFVEIDNTDAEGRLILADALARAAEDHPELIIDFATLTGAARVALGPDLPAFFSTSEELAAEAAAAAGRSDDPIWRMPLWDPYDEMLKSDIADLANAANSPMAGSIIAALFLKRFVPDQIQWAHFDTYAWRDAAKPGRPKGGEALGLRAMFAFMKARYLHA
ncbi:leucyl aminopeptidase family protein [Sphingomonas agri]|uniref:leucyl aminopeptidase family protein n=1 Tax=Sphingomonas agri TaxID=1813878 RepID=UPI00311DC59A